MRLWVASFPAARPPTACARRLTLEFGHRGPGPDKEPPAWRWSTFRSRKALRSPRGAAVRGRADHRRAPDNAGPWPRGPNPATPQLVLPMHGPGWSRGWKETRARSEEHTSELQSLMRISYS